MLDNEFDMEDMETGKDKVAALEATMTKDEIKEKFKNATPTKRTLSKLTVNDDVRLFDAHHNKDEIARVSKMDFDSISDLAVMRLDDGREVLVDGNLRLKGMLRRAGEKGLSSDEVAANVRIIDGNEADARIAVIVLNPAKGGVPLSRVEMGRAIEPLVNLGHSNVVIGKMIGRSEKAIRRYRKAANLPDTKVVKTSGGKIMQTHNLGEHMKPEDDDADIEDESSEGNTEKKAKHKKQATKVKEMVGFQAKGEKPRTVAAFFSGGHSQDVLIRWEKLDPPPNGVFTRKGDTDQTTVNDGHWVAKDGYLYIAAKAKKKAGGKPGKTPAPKPAPKKAKPKPAPKKAKPKPAPKKKKKKKNTL